MYITTDDEMYRVDSVWLGPPKATVPWRARYVAWGIGLTLTLVILSVLRIWVAFGVFPVAWSIVSAVAITRLIGRKITHERPLRDVARMVLREVKTPRMRTTPTSGAADLTAVRVRAERPKPKPRRQTTRPSQGQETVPWAS